MELVPAPTIPTLTITSLGIDTGYGGGLISAAAVASAVWPSANRAVFVPFWIETSIVVTYLWVANGTAVSGNFDIGLYSEYGTRLYHAGSVSHSGTSQIQSIATSPAVRLEAGIYFMALAFDNGTATTERRNPSLVNQRLGGIQQMASAFQLPPTGTFASSATSHWPLFGLSTFYTRVA